MKFEEKLDIALECVNPVFDILEFLIPRSIMNEAVEGVGEGTGKCEWCDKVFNKYREWFRSLGIHGKPVSVDSGAVGYAYIFPDKVIKFTKSKLEMEVAKVLMRRKANLPNLAHIYDCKDVGEWDGKRRYVIVQERVDTGVAKRHRMAGMLVYDYLDKTQPYRGIGGLENFKRKSTGQIIGEIQQVVASKYYKRGLHKDPIILKLVRELVDAIKHIYESTGILMYDPHGRNLGFKGRKISLFDLGRSEISP